MPVRKVRSTGSNIIGRVSTIDARRRVHFESTLERDLFIALRFDVNVQSFEEQPVRIEYKDDTGKARHYTPDVLVRYRRDIEPAKHMPFMLCEVKYAEDLKRRAAEYAPKFAAAQAYVKGQGWEFRVLDETMIRTPYFENARFLYPYLIQPTNDEYRSRLLQQLFELRLTTPEALLTSIYRDALNRARLIPMLWKLIAEYRIGADLTQKLTMHSQIWAMREDAP
jgi:hypothetical protein